MSAPVELVPLLCVRCQTPVPAQVDEVAWVCANCGQGLLLDDLKGAVPLEVHFALGLDPNKKGRPFWVARGMVSIHSRQSYRGGDQGSQAQKTWSQPQTFFVPACACTLDQIIQAGAALLARPPALQDGPSAPFEPVVILPDEVKAYAEFIIMGVEAGRKDDLKELQFDLSLEPPGLWIFP